MQALGGDTAQYAKQNKLVDELASRAVVDQQLIKVFGRDDQTKSFKGTSIYDYNVKYDTTSKGNVAVIVANGAIMDGEETPGNVGSDTTAMQIRDARLDPNIKAIVFRVNSGRQRYGLRSNS